LSGFSAPRKLAAVGALALSLAIGLALGSPLGDGLYGLSLDGLTSLSLALYGPGQPAADSPVAILALDEETYKAPPFKSSPTVAWTNEIAHTLAATLDAGGKVVGFDVVFAHLIEDAEIPFGTDTVGERLRGFDRDYLRTIARYGRSGRLVLGEADLGGEAFAPSAAQRLAIGSPDHVRALNVATDRDHVVRRLPIDFLNRGGGATPSLSLELAARASDAGADNEAKIAWGRARGSGRAPDALTLNFGARVIPWFSLADLRLCLESGDTEFFRRNFAGKALVLGTIVETEDRVMSSMRFSTTPIAASGERCGAPSPAPALFRGGAIPGIFLQATGVANLMRNDGLREPGATLAAAIVVAAALLGSAAALAWRAWLAATATAVALALALAASVVAFRAGFVFPWLPVAVAAAASLIATEGFRFVMAEREKRLLRSAFGLYLSPAIIDRIHAEDALPELGGESREITILFSDVVGFSSISEALPPQDLVTLMNDYLTAMSEVIEASGGYVDKYVGDAIVALFGAPARSTSHAADGVAAALACRQRLQAFNRDAAAVGRPALGQRIGLNTGVALVGNVGSKRRFNYTALGDAVNVAARLEPLNKSYGTDILVSAATRDAAGERFVWREIDTVTVRGRAQDVTIFEPLAAAGDADAATLARAARYEAGLAAWRAGDKESAGRAFAELAGEDRAAAAFAQRCRAGA